jgi:hypothetical protein
VGPGLAGNREPDVNERTDDLGDDVVGAVLVAVTTMPATVLYAAYVPSAVVPEIIVSIRSRTRLAMLEGCPSQLGVAMTRDARMRTRYPLPASGAYPHIHEGEAEHESLLPHRPP